VGLRAQPMDDYLGMLITLLSLKRKRRNRLGSSLFSLPNKLVQRCGIMPLVQSARPGRHREVTLPGLPQIRTCAINASGSSE
jgi:hypothetical protein